MILVSPAAADALGRLLNSKGVGQDSHGLRLKIQKGGCAGLRYDMHVDEIQASDRVVRSMIGAKVLIDPISLPFLEGCELDYIDTLSEQGFRVRNPKATRNCGCGTSFELPSPPPQNLPQGEDCPSTAIA
jgi:iron-sulfur cluster assembly accessory protein